MTHCPNCDHDVPEGGHCVRCGEPLGGAGSPKRGFPAAPTERTVRPALVSTLFPQLPSDDMNDYRLALVGGSAIVLGLGLAGMFPLGLVAAAMLVPLLTTVYLYDVDVYEDQPAFVTAFTLVWGLLAGVGVALLARTVSPTGADAFAQSGDASAVVTVVLLPLLAVVLAIGGPALVLLPNRRFNDVLDGAAFGAASAAALVGAEVVVYGFNLLGDGLTPGGDTLPWLLRLLSIAVLVPVINMAACGSACATLWLRFRGPGHDRGALGVLGSPLVALPLAGAVAVLAALGQRELPIGAWLATLVVLAGLTLVWLRMTLRIGLLQEASEKPIGPDVTCPNCGSQTPEHTFCSTCGISLQATPKDRDQ
jgi:hypothetical protein